VTGHESLTESRVNQFRQIRVTAPVEAPIEQGHSEAHDNTHAKPQWVSEMKG
jgi:hypothetical protein